MQDATGSPEAVGDNGRGYAFDFLFFGEDFFPFLLTGEQVEEIGVFLFEGCFQEVAELVVGHQVDVLALAHDVAPDDFAVFEGVVGFFVLQGECIVEFPASDIVFRGVAGRYFIEFSFAFEVDVVVG